MPEAEEQNTKGLFSTARERDNDRRMVRLLGDIRDELKAIKGIDAAILLKMSSGATGRRAVGFDFSVGLPQTKEKETDMLSVKITNEQQVVVTIAPKTDTGKPAQIDGKPSVTQLSGTSSFVQSEDGLSVLLVSGNDPGESQFIIKADANLAPAGPDAGQENYEEISDIITLTVEGATAKNLGLTAGTPTAKPEVVPPVDGPVDPNAPADRRRR